MRSIAIMNQKGGVGKTTTAVNTAAALAEAGCRVGVIDLDPQAHATLHFGIESRPGDPSIYEVLTQDIPLSEARHQVAENLWVIGSQLDLAGAEVELAGVVGREQILSDKIAEDAPALDYLIIDCPPSLGILTLNALAAVDEVLIPLEPHFFALHGLSRLLETIGLVSRRINRRLKLGGVVFCKYNASTRLANEVAEDVETFFKDSRHQNTPWAETTVFQTRIRRNVRLAEAPSYGRPIFDYSPKCNGAEDYRCLALEVASQFAQPVKLHEPEAVLERISA